MAAKDMCLTRQSRWERVPTTKVAEQEKIEREIVREWEDSGED